MKREQSIRTIKKTIHKKKTGALGISFSCSVYYINLRRYTDDSWCHSELFFRYDGISPVEFIGFRNYVIAFQDDLFYRSLWVTFYFAFGSLLPTVAISLFFSYSSQPKVVSFCESDERNLFFTDGYIDGRDRLCLDVVI